MKKLSNDQIIYLYPMNVKKTCGLDGIRDEGLLN